MSKAEAENFCTLFDSSYLLQGIALYISLKKHQPKARLWVLCMDDKVVASLKKLNFPDLMIIPLAEIETPELLKVKPSRSKGEYCWTLTPFLPSFVLNTSPDIEDVTYLDADLFLFDKPAVLIDEMRQAGKQVLITEHAYDPQYEQSQTSGRFCVQFVTFTQGSGAKAVLAKWQSQCLEWCFARHEDGKFGDQKYLDNWPTEFGSIVHIAQAVERTLAPWNVEYFKSRWQNGSNPVFYHFHYFRVLSESEVRQHFGYKLSRTALTKFYKPYLETLADCKSRLKSVAVELNFHTLAKESFPALRKLKRMVSGTVSYARY